jgi:hypothetical protein
MALQEAALFLVLKEQPVATEAELTARSGQQPAEFQRSLAAEFAALGAATVGEQIEAA